MFTRKSKGIEETARSIKSKGDTMFYSEKPTNFNLARILGQFAWVVLACLIALFLCLQPKAQVLTETIATGGILVNNQDGVDNLLVNPARLSYSNFHFKLGGVGLTFDANNREFFKFIRDHKTDLSDWSNLTVGRQDSIKNRLSTLENHEAMLQISPIIGMAFRKFAVAAYATSKLDLELNLNTPLQDELEGEGPKEPEERVELSALQHTEAVIMVGISNQIHKRLALGINARFINSWQNSNSDVDWEKAANVGNWLKLLWEDKQNLTSGYSVGAGLSMMPINSFYLEYTADNLVYRLGDQGKNIRSSIQVTTMFSKKNILSKFLSARAIRLSGSISSEDNALPEFDMKKASAGIEIDYPLLKLRGGIRENRYSYGANINLALFNVGYACQIDGEKSRYHSLAVTVEF